MVMVLSQDIPSDKEIYYRRSLIEATDKASYQYGKFQYAKRQYGPAPSELYNNRYHDNIYHGRTYGANLYPHLSRVTSTQQMTFVRKRMAHVMPTHQNKSTSSPSWKQRIIRDEFRVCVDCFNIQPYTGGAGPGEPGPKDRAYWYTIKPLKIGWYYNRFIHLTLKELREVGTPGWCKWYYLYIYTDPPDVETHPDYDYMSQPFTIHAEVWDEGVYQGTMTPWNCVKKVEGTQGWEQSLGKYKLETCCTNVHTPGSLATEISLEVRLKPIYSFQAQSGLQKQDWDWCIHVTNGTGSVSNVTYVDKDNSPITGERIPFLIDGSSLTFKGNGLLQINPASETAVSAITRYRQGRARTKDDGWELSRWAAWYATRSTILADPKIKNDSYAFKSDPYYYVGTGYNRPGTSYRLTYKMWPYDHEINIRTTRTGFNFGILPFEPTSMYFIFYAKKQLQVEENFTVLIRQMDEAYDEWYIWENCPIVGSINTSKIIGDYAHYYIPLSLSPFDWSKPVILGLTTSHWGDYTHWMTCPVPKDWGETGTIYNRVMPYNTGTQSLKYT